MAGEQTKAFIESQRKSGKTDSDIFSSMANNPKFSAGIRQGNKLGYSNQEIAIGLGLNLNSQKKKNDVPAVKSKPKAESPGKAKGFIIGAVNDVGGGINQLDMSIRDGASSLINNIFGTNLDTNRYERVTAATKKVNDAYEAQRQAAGETGIDGARLLGNIAATIPAGGLAKGFGGAKILSKAGAKVLAQNAAVGGVIGGAGFAENADQRKANIAAGAVGGAVGGVIGDKLGKGIAKVTHKVSSSAKASAQARISQTIDDQIEIALEQSGVKIGDLSDDIVNGLRKDVATALKSGKAINKEAVARKVVFDRVGIQPTKAQLTGDRKLWQTQAELAKIQGAGDKLRDKLVQDNQQLSGLLDDLAIQTGSKADDAYGAASGAVDALTRQQTQNKAFIDAAYDSARKAPGNDVVLDGRGFANDAITKLDEQYSLSNLPASVSKIIKDIEKNPQSFTLGKSEELIKILNREHGASLTNGQPSSSTYAIGIVRDALENRQSEAMKGLLSSGGNDAAQAYQFARNAYKFNAQQIESIPLLKDVVKGVEPDKLFQKRFLNGNVNEIKKTVDLLNDVDPQSVADIKGQVIKYISEKAVNQNGQFSPAGMKRALDAIGDRRLATLFTPDEVMRIKDIGMAGRYLVTQPDHSYINNSNTSSAIMNFLGKIIDKPGVRVLLSPLKDVADSVKVSRSLKSSVAADAKSTALADVMFSGTDKKLIDRLTKAGVIGSANLNNH